jgi:hypothetical protein
MTYALEDSLVSPLGPLVALSFPLSHLLRPLILSRDMFRSIVCLALAAALALSVPAAVSSSEVEASVSSGARMLGPVPTPFASRVNPAGLCPNSCPGWSTGSSATRLGPYL